jgi:hypothetical protein
MSYINFIISRINYLPYYVPLVIEAKNRNIQSNFFLYGSDKKFASPYELNHMEQLQQLASQYNIKLYDITKIRKFPGITFFCEGDIVGKKDKHKPSNNFQYMTHKHIKVSIVCNYEYVMFYKDYINNVDHVIMPHKFWGQYYQTLSYKNLYLGSPKYDMKYFNMYNTLEEKHYYLSKKYKLDSTKKYILIIYPKDPKKHHKKGTLYPNEKDLLQIYKAIRESGYNVIVKTRKQDPITNNELKGDHYFEDIDFYPCNSMELIEISKMVIYFSSSINEECVALKKPYIDIKVDLYKNRFECLNHISYGICWEYANLIQFDIKDRIIKFIKYLEKVHYQSDEINSESVCTNNYSKIVWEGGENASSRIIDWVVKHFDIKSDINDAIN